MRTEFIIPMPLLYPSLYRSPLNLYTKVQPLFLKHWFNQVPNIYLTSASADLSPDLGSHDQVRAWWKNNWDPLTRRDQKETLLEIQIPSHHILSYSNVSHCSSIDCPLTRGIVNRIGVKDHLCLACTMLLIIKDVGSWEEVTDEGWPENKASWLTAKVGHPKSVSLAMGRSNLMINLVNSPYLFILVFFLFVTFFLLLQESSDS